MTTRSAPRSALVALLALAAPLGCTLEQTLTTDEAHGDDTRLTTVVSEDLASLPSDEGWLLLPALKDAPAQTRVALMLELTSESERPVLEVRGYRENGSVSDWFPVELSWREAGLAVARADFPEALAAPELRLREQDASLVVNLQYTAVTPPVDEALDGDDSVGIEAPGTEEQGLSSQLAGIGVKSRGQWGARTTRCTSNDGQRYRMAVHHTVTATSYGGSYAARVRQIQSFHMDGRGWCDVGYHFLVTMDGSVFEGRPLEKIGAHVRNNNSGNIGVSFVGCFQPGGACNGIDSPLTPTTASLTAGAQLLSKLSGMFNIPRTTTYVKGHRQHSGQTTSCPGDNLLAKIGQLLASTPAPPPPPPSTPASCFDDVGGTWAEGDICQLKALGLTSGCSATSYCPNNEVTRAQMAVFLDRTYQHLTGAAAPVVSTPFVDIQGSWAETSIKRIYGLGITSGVDATHFAPSGVVTRAQMAAFLERLYRSVKGSSAPAVSTPFVDIQGHWAETAIKRIYGLNITHGVSSTQFGPGLVVTRAQMAAFLVRTVGVLD